MTPYELIKAAVLGNPYDPNKKPSRQGVVQAFAALQRQMDSAQAGAYVKSTLSALNALVVAPVSSMAYVVNDATMANNGIYENTGTASAAVWTRRSDIPQFTITALNVSAGTGDAIEADTDVPIPTEDGRALIFLPITDANTISPPTVRFNGTGTAYVIKSNTGNNVAVDGLQPGMVLAGFISGSTFRLINDQASAAIVAAAEAFAESASESADRAEDAAEALETGGVPIFDDLSELQALTAANFAKVALVHDSIYRRNDADNTSADDGLDRIVDASSRRWWRLNEDRVTFNELGFSTGVDQSALFTSKLALIGGKKLDLQGKTLKLNSLAVTTLPQLGIDIRNGTLDLSGAANTNIAFNVMLTQPSSFTIAGGIAQAASTITMPTAGHGLTKGDLIYIQSDDSLFTDDTPTQYYRSEWATVGYVSGTTVVTVERIKLAYTTNVRVTKPNLIENIRLENIKLIGRGDHWNTGNSNNNQEFMTMEWVKKLQLFGVEGFGFGRQFFGAYRVHDAHMDRCNLVGADSRTGTAYGIQFSKGCHSAKVTATNFSDMRHGISGGSTYGTDWNMHYEGNTCTGMTDAGIDCHPNMIFANIANNLVDGYGWIAGGSLAGITFQGSHGTISGNKIKNVQGSGIIAQLFGRLNEYLKIENNEIECVNSGTVSAQNFGVLVQNWKPAGVLDSIHICGNQIKAEQSYCHGIYFQCMAGGGLTTEHMKIDKNSVRTRMKGIYVNNQAGDTISFFSVNDNTVRCTETSDSSNHCIELASASGGSAGQIGTINDNIVIGGYVGIKQNYQRCTATGNRLISFGAGGAFSGTFDAGGVNATT